MRLAARTWWGSYSAPPDSLAVIRGRGREGWKEEMGRGRSVRGEGADGERRYRKRGGMTGLGCLSSGLQVPSDATA